MNLNLGVLRRKTMALSRGWSQPPLLCAREAERALLAEGGRGARGRDSRQASPLGSGWHQAAGLHRLSLGLGCS